MFPYPPHPGIDKSSWGEGPWQHEPDAVSWVDQRTGLNCALIRHPELGQWNGYVAIEPGHPLFGKSYSSSYRIPESRSDLGLMGRDYGVVDLFLSAGDKPGFARLSLLLISHGSVTYSDEDTNGFWWFGFDCGHADDYQPGMMGLLEGVPERTRKAFVELRKYTEYRDQGYATGITTRLAWALQEFRTVALVGQQDEDAS